jgi:ribosomal protein S18 acetylase RimI-like enzyme
MEPTAFTPIRLSPERKDPAAEILAQAFRDDPLYSHVFPNADQRLRSTRSLWRAVLTVTLRYGEVYTTSDLHGAACWMRPGRPELSLWQSLRTGFALQRAVARFPTDARSRFLDVIGYVDNMHEQVMPQPHWYLWVLGVAPEHQGRGVGGKLLQPVLAEADRNRLPCYLETESERNVAFYRKHGFEVISADPPPPQGVQLWLMLRQPA